MRSAGGEDSDLILVSSSSKQVLVQARSSSLLRPKESARLTLSPLVRDSACLTNASASCPSWVLTEELVSSSRRQRERIVSRSEPFLAVVRINKVCLGGSSSAFNSAFWAGSVSLSASSIHTTLLTGEVVVSDLRVSWT